MTSHVAKGALAALSIAVAGLVAGRRWHQRKPPSSLDHLRLGRVWEYDILPAGGFERIEVIEVYNLGNGRQAFRVEYRREDSALDAVFSSDAQGRLVQLSQSGEAASFDPPLVGLGKLEVGAYWTRAGRHTHLYLPELRWARQEALPNGAELPSDLRHSADGQARSGRSALSPAWASHSGAAHFVVTRRRVNLRDSASRRAPGSDPD